MQETKNNNSQDSKLEYNEKEILQRFERVLRDKSELENFVARERWKKKKPDNKEELLDRIHTMGQILTDIGMVMLCASNLRLSILYMIDSGGLYASATKLKDYARILEKVVAEMKSMLFPWSENMKTLRLTYEKGDYKGGTPCEEEKID